VPGLFPSTAAAPLWDVEKSYHEEFIFDGFLLAREEPLGLGRERLGVSTAIRSEGKTDAYRYGRNRILNE